MLPRLNVNHHMKWYSRQTNRWSYRPRLPFISIEIGSPSKLDSSAHSIRLLLGPLDFFIFLIFSIHLLLNSLLFISIFFLIFKQEIRLKLVHPHPPSIFFLILKISWLIRKKAEDHMFYGHFYFFPFRNISCKSFWNSSQQLQRCTSNDFCISRSPIVLGKRCHLSKMPFQFNQWPAKFNSFSVLKGQKSYWENTGGG